MKLSVVGVVYLAARTENSSLLSPRGIVPTGNPAGRGAEDLDRASTVVVMAVVDTEVGEDLAATSPKSENLQLCLRTD